MKKSLFIFLLTLLLAGCTKDTDSFMTISLNEVEEKVANGYIILDVREVDEFKSGHIPGAKNKPLSELEKENFSNLNKEEKYVVICRSGNRSITASNILYKEGYEIVNVSEGISSWKGDLEY